MKRLLKWFGIVALGLIAALALAGGWLWHHRVEIGFVGVNCVLPAKEVKAYQDVRWWNLRRLDFRGQKDLLASLDFNRKTRWPDRTHLPSDLQPGTLLTNAMNPGLGVRDLHRQGLTGKGVGVAIIDQPLPGRHPEYIGKLVAYRDFGSREPTSMHGPAVTSVLVGTQCGTAPEACLYYAACPLSEYAQALEWVLEENRKLARAERIRLVSVSAAPSGPGSFVGDRKEWDAACQRAEAAGMVVLDCTTHRGFIGCCYYDKDDPEDVVKCRSGYPGLKPWPRKNDLLAPGSPRTKAEEYLPGENGYHYSARGGQSLAVPYCAGVMALGFQVRPDLSGPRVKQLLVDTAYVGPNGAKIINPPAFIAAVRQEESHAAGPNEAVQAKYRDQGMK